MLFLLAVRAAGALVASPVGHTLHKVPHQALIAERKLALDRFANVPPYAIDTRKQAKGPHVHQK